MPKNIVMLDTVEDSVRTFLTDEIADTPVPKNAIAAEKSRVLSRAPDEEMVTIIFFMPKDGEFIAGDRQAARLIKNGHAAEI